VETFLCTLGGWEAEEEAEMEEHAVVREAEEALETVDLAGDRRG
jgi:hypothetical protein